MSTCPKCRTQTLVPIVGAGGGEAPSRCMTCRGVWVPRNAVVVEELERAAPTREASAAADARVGLCPAGHGLLRRAKLGGALDFALDRCSHCGGTWFDAGEWHEIATRRLLESLDDLWDPLHQRHVREQQTLDHWRDQLAGALGEQTLDDLERLADVLAHHPAGPQALAFLQESIRSRHKA